MAPKAPSRVEMREKLRDLLEGRISRRDASLWAHQWVTADDAGVEDRVVWDALIRLGSADLGGEPEEYLYFESDFHAWLDEVEDAIDSPS